MVEVYGFMCGVLLGVLFWFGYAGVGAIFIISITTLGAVGCVVAAIDECENERRNNG